MKQNDPLRPIFNGEPGESCFIQPFTDFHHSRQNNFEAPEIYRKIESSGDHRSLTLITALLVENSLDRILSSFLPGYNGLTSHREVTFSLKTDILKSLALIPPKILTCADVIRQVRNQFAHDLEIDDLDKIAKGKKQALKQSCVTFFGKNDNDDTVEKQFNKVASIAIYGIQSYIPNVVSLREKIEDEQFIIELARESQKRWLDTVKTIMSEKPIEIKEENGSLVTVYRDGVVAIGEVPSKGVK